MIQQADVRDARCCQQWLIFRMVRTRQAKTMIVIEFSYQEGYPAFSSRHRLTVIRRPMILAYIDICLAVAAANAARNARRCARSSKSKKRGTKRLSYRCKNTDQIAVQFLRRT